MVKDERRGDARREPDERSCNTRLLSNDFHPGQLIYTDHRAAVGVLALHQISTLCTLYYCLPCDPPLPL